MSEIASIDRFEEEWAVLVVDGQERRVPRKDLPKEAKEGDAIDLQTLEVDPEQTERLRAEVSAARARLRRDPGGSL